MAEPSPLLSTLDTFKILIGTVVLSFGARVTFPISTFIGAEVETETVMEKD